MLTTTTNNIEGYRILCYYRIITHFQEDEWDENLTYAVIGLQRSAKAWVEYAFEDEDVDVDHDFALIGVHLVSASTYTQDDDGATKLDIIAYGTLVRIEPISEE